MKHSGMAHNPNVLADVSRATQAEKLCSRRIYNCYRVIDIVPNKTLDLHNGHKMAVYISKALYALHTTGRFDNNTCKNYRQYLLSISVSRGEPNHY